MDSDFDSDQGQCTDWRPAVVSRLLGVSGSAHVGLMNNGRTVLKYPVPWLRDGMKALYEEAARFDKLKPHDNLVVFEGIHQNGLLFEYCELGSLDLILICVPHTLTQARKMIIAGQVVLCLVHLHQQNFIHCDLCTRNVFITADWNAKIGDIQGQLYRPDGTIEFATQKEENAQSRHPEAGKDEFTVRTDLFALGTLLFHLFHEEMPFPDLVESRKRDAIRTKFRMGEFPVDVDHANGMDAIIAKCWTSKYTSANEVIQDMEYLDEE